MARRAGRRSISDIVAVVMLIIIAIAAAVLIYAWISGLIGATHTSATTFSKFEMVGGNISPPSSSSSSSSYTVIATIDNIGGTPVTINYLAVEYASNSSVICSTAGTLTSKPSLPLTISPGSTSTVSFTCSPSSTNIPAGTSVNIVASSTDGVTATYSTTWP